MEDDLLVRLIFCVDPNAEAAAGLKAKAMRSLGFDTEGLEEKEQSYREALRKKFKMELIPYKDIAGKPGKIPSLGPPATSNVEWSVPIPYAVLAMMGEKIARGCEWRIKKRFVECPPYDIRIFTPGPRTKYHADIVQFVTPLDFGPGCHIERVFDPNEPHAVAYSIMIWNTLHLLAMIDLPEKLAAVDAMCPKKEGIDPSEIASAMHVSPYLRDYQDHN